MTTTFEFEATGDPKKHGQPYVAKLVLNSEGKLSREFFHLDRLRGKKTVTIFGPYTVSEGELIERRDSDGSWRNDDRVIKLCIGTKLYTVADPDTSSDMPAVSRYLKTGIMPGEWRKAIIEAINRRIQKDSEKLGAKYKYYGVGPLGPLGQLEYKGEPTAY